MKTLVVGFFVLLSIISSCEEQVINDSDSIVGSWDWIYSSGGIAGMIETPETTGNSKRLIFNDSLIYWIEKDTLQQLFHYSIQKEKTIFSTDLMPVLKIVEQSSPSKVIFLKGDTLSLADNFPDGFIQTFLRAKD